MKARRWSELSDQQQTALLVAASVQLSLAVTAWADLYSRPAALVNGRKGVWAAIIGVNSLGPWPTSRGAVAHASESHEAPPRAVIAIALTGVGAITPGCAGALPPVPSSSLSYSCHAGWSCSGTTPRRWPRVRAERPVFQPPRRVAGWREGRRVHGSDSGGIEAVRVFHRRVGSGNTSASCPSSRRTRSSPTGSPDVWRGSTRPGGGGSATAPSPDPSQADSLSVGGVGAWLLRDQQ